MNFSSISVFSQKSSDSTANDGSNSGGNSKKTANQQEFEAYMMSAESSPHKAPPAQTSFANSIGSTLSGLGRPNVNKSEGKSQAVSVPPETKTASQEEYEQYEATAENSPYKSPHTNNTSKSSFASFGSKIALSLPLGKKSSTQKDLHVDATNSNHPHSSSSADHSHYEASAENSPYKAPNPQAKPRKLADRMKAVSEFTANLGKNISDMLDLPEPTTNKANDHSTSNNHNSNNSNEKDIFSSSVLDVVKSLGNELKEGAKHMIPSKSTAGSSNASASTTTSSASVPGKPREGPSNPVPRKVKPPPPKENTKMFDYLEMSKDDEEHEPLRYEPSHVTEVPPVKPAKPSKHSNNSGSSFETPAKSVMSEYTETTASSMSSAQDTSFDIYSNNAYLAHNISLNTSLTPMKSPDDSTGPEDHIDSLLRSIYEAEQAPADNAEDNEVRGVRACSSEDCVEEVNKVDNSIAVKALSKEDAVEYDDDFCV